MDSPDLHQEVNSKKSASKMAIWVRLHPLQYCSKNGDHH